MAGPGAGFFGSSATMASVVIRSAATEAAFWIAGRINRDIENERVNGRDGGGMQTIQPSLAHCNGVPRPSQSRAQEQHSITRPGRNGELLKHSRALADRDRSERVLPRQHRRHDGF
jgi:hypothetical protein